MSIRKSLFSFFNRYIDDTTHFSFRSLIAVNQNQQMIEKGRMIQATKEAGAMIQNQERIQTSRMDELELKKYELLKRYKNEGLLDDNVNPDDVLLQIDRIEFIQKLKHIEEYSGSYSQDVVDLYRTMAKVHLEEPKFIQFNYIIQYQCSAQQNLEALYQSKPWLRKYEYLSLL